MLHPYYRFPIPNSNAWGGIYKTRAKRAAPSTTTALVTPTVPLCAIAIAALEEEAAAAADVFEAVDPLVADDGLPVAAGRIDDATVEKASLFAAKVTDQPLVVAFAQLFGLDDAEPALKFTAAHYGER
jgi:hypothetical protein